MRGNSRKACVRPKQEVRAGAIAAFESDRARDVDQNFRLFGEFHKFCGNGLFGRRIAPDRPNQGGQRISSCRGVTVCVLRPRRRWTALSVAEGERVGYAGAATARSSARDAIHCRRSPARDQMPGEIAAINRRHDLGSSTLRSRVSYQL